MGVGVGFSGMVGIRVKIASAVGVDVDDDVLVRGGYTSLGSSVGDAPSGQCVGRRLVVHQPPGVTV